MYLPFYQRGSEDTNEAERDTDEIDKELNSNIEEYRQHQISVQKNKLANQSGQLIRDDGMGRDEGRYPEGEGHGPDYKNPYRYLRYK